jgi:hypothetical protein
VFNFPEHFAWFLPAAPESDTGALTRLLPGQCPKHHGVMWGTLSPGSGGPLVDPDGQRWTMTRRRLDLRLVRRALRSADRRVLLGENVGCDLSWVGPDERPALWARLRDKYFGPGGTEYGEYSAYEFVNDDGDSLTYIEVSCSWAASIWMAGSVAWRGID